MSSQPESGSTEFLPLGSNEEIIALADRMLQEDSVRKFDELPLRTREQFYLLLCLAGREMCEMEPVYE